jgi:hypothetical protein
MYELLLVLIVLMFVAVKTKEHFGLVVGGRDIVTTDTTVTDGVEVFSTYPETCPPGKERGALLCYNKCRPGFRGVGPVCWSYTQSVGVGKPVGLEPCPAGWSNDGMICRQPLRWNPCAWRGLFKECWGGLEGGRLVGRLNSGGICDYPQDRSKLPSWLRDGQHPERIAGLCYKKCPADKPNRIPGMPYLCAKEARLSYTRDAGSIPKILRIGRVWNPF